VVLDSESERINNVFLCYVTFLSTLAYVISKSILIIK